MNELTTTRTLEVIGAEIRAHAISMEFHMRGTVNEAVEIGRRLVEARDMAKHGKWMPFLEKETPFSYDKANNLIKVFEAYGDQQKNLFGTELSNFDTYQNLSYSQALALLALPSGEREEFVETHAVEDMTTRELQQAIRERDEAKAAAEAAATHAGQLKRELDDANQTVERLLDSSTKYEEDNQALTEDNKDLAYKLRQATERVKELESRPIDVAVQVDEEAVKRAADEARAAAEAEWSAKVREAEDKLAKAQEKAKKAEEKAKSAGEKSSGEAEKYKAEAEHLRAEIETIRQAQAEAAKSARVASDADLTLCKEYYERATEYANKMHGLLLKAREHGDDASAETTKKAMLALADFVRGCVE